MSLIFATQLTAVATLALAVFALAAAVLALLAWRKQSAEVRDQAKMLELQSAEFKVLALTRQRELLAERSAQAELVYLTTTWDSSEKELTGHVRNTSQQPVYDLMFHPDPDESTFEFLTLLPGHELSHRYGNYSPIALRIMPRQQMPSVSFRDRAGIRWATWPDGGLSDLGEQQREVRDTEPWIPLADAERWIEDSMRREMAPNEDGGSPGPPPGPAPGRT